MFQARAYCASEEAYQAAKLISSLHEQGIGFAEAAKALDVIVEAVWSLCQAASEADDDWDFEFAGHLVCDRTVSVRGEYWYDEETTRSGLHVCIQRDPAFLISIATEHYGGELFDRGDELDRHIAIQADRPDELIKFLPLTRLIGGEIEVRNGD